MSDVLSRIFRIFKNESGATAIEYGLIAALISIAMVAGAQSIGGNLSSTFSNLNTKMALGAGGGGAAAR